MTANGQLPLTELSLRLGAAMLVGAALGINRDLRNKPAGLKTHSLVTIGSTLLTILIGSFAGAASSIDADALSRVAQGIITGIGFLGTGVILRGQTGHDVQGLTTAASIWLAACLGIACGVGSWPTVVLAMAMTFIVLILGDRVERAIYRRWHGAKSRPAGGGA